MLSPYEFRDFDSPLERVAARMFSDTHFDDFERYFKQDLLKDRPLLRFGSSGHQMRKEDDKVPFFSITFWLLVVLWESKREIVTL